MSTVVFAIVALQLAAIAGCLLYSRAGGKRVLREMRALYGAQGFSPAWTGCDGNRWKMCLATGRTVKEGVR